MNSKKEKLATRNNDSHPTAVCFRFRNKSVVDAIDEHISIIKNSGYVWWGWWAKKYEDAPELITKHIIDASSVAIYLINPKENKYYKATGETFASFDGDDMACPEPEFTPEYYQYMESKIWIKILSIQLMSESEVTCFFSQYSFCHARDHLVDENVGLRDIEFNDIQANCIEVFTMQPVSIWLLRDRKETDKSLKELNELLRLWLRKGMT